MENECDLLHEVEILQKAVNESSEHTKRQLDAIKSNFSLEAIVSIIVAIGIPYYLDIFTKYWIPSAFLLFIIWFIFSIFSQLWKKNRSKKDTSSEKKKIIQINLLQKSLQAELLFKNIMPGIKALSVIYLISLLIIIIIPPQWIDLGDFVTIIPIIPCIFMIFASFSVFRLEQDYSKEESEKQKEYLTTNFLILGGITLIVILILAVSLIISLIITCPSDEPIFDNIRFFGLMILLQIFTMIMVGRFFNILNVQKELGYTLANYAEINSLLHYYSLRDLWDYKKIEELKSQYLKSKRYEVFPDSSMQICNFYMFKPNCSRYHEMERESEIEKPDNNQRL